MAPTLLAEYAGSADGTSFPITFSQASTPGKTVVAVVMSSAIVDTPAGWSKTNIMPIAAVDNCVLILPAASHTAPLSSLMLTLQNSRSPAVVIFEDYIDGDTFVYPWSDGGNDPINSGALWGTNLHTFTADVGLAFFCASGALGLPLNGDVTSYDQSYVELGDSGESASVSNEHARVWLAHGADMANNGVSASFSPNLANLSTQANDGVSAGMAGYNVGTPPAQMPLSIPWDAALWADSPGFVAPSQDAAIPSLPDNLAGGSWAKGGTGTVTWETDIGGTGKPAFVIPSGVDLNESAFPDSANYTFVLVARVPAFSNFVSFLASTAGARFSTYNNGSIWYSSAGTGNFGSTADNDLHLFIIQFSNAGNRHIHYIDNVEVDNTVIATNTSGTGAKIGQAAAHDLLHVAFAGFYSGHLTTQERDDLWAWYQTAYAVAPPYANVVHEENDLAGNAVDITPSVANGEVGYLGYSKQFSVNAGSTIDFAVDGLLATDIDIYRLGHYGGAGKRLVTSLSNTPTDQPAGTTIADSNGATQMAWTTSASWAVPAATVSGLFVAAVKDTGGTVRSWIPFVVRNDSRDADVVVKVSDSTWGAAYNYFGDVGSEKSGKDVYGIGAIGNIGDRSYAVSYDRPIVSRGGGTAAVINHWDSHEWALIDWLEENGVDVKYIGSYDLDQQDVTDVLGASKVFISAGHDEYWSDGMRDNLAAWRDTGKHLLFMSANEVFWRVRWADGGRTMWCYKDTMQDATDPVSWTGTFRDTRRPAPGPNPESLLTGTFFRMNNEDSIGRAASVSAATYGSNPFWRDTTMETGTDFTTGVGLIGFEADEVRPRDTGYALLAAQDLTLPGSYADDNGQNYDGTGDITWGIVAVYMSATAGLTVGFGTCQWMWALSDRHDRGGNITSLAARQATMNLLYDLGVTAPTIQTDLVEPTPVALATYGVTYTGIDPEGEAPPTTGSIWQPEVPPDVTTPVDASYVKLSTRFTVAADGRISKLWFYKGDPTDPGVPVNVFLANMTTEVVLASTTVNVGTQTGWIGVDLPSEVNVYADGTIYGACYGSPSTMDYAVVANYPEKVSGQITALAGGWYNYTGDATAIPGGALSASSYLVDVSYTEGLAAGQAGSIWHPASLTVPTPGADATDYVLMTRFTVGVDGTIDRLWYWKQDAGDWSPVTASIIDFTNGTVLGQVNVDWGAGIGWQEAVLPSPVAVSADSTIYGACIAVNAADDYTYDTGAVYPLTVGSLTALGISYAQTSADTATTGFTSAAADGAYYIDVAFTPAGGGGGEVQNFHVGPDTVIRAFDGPTEVIRAYTEGVLVLGTPP